MIAQYNETSELILSDHSGWMQTYYGKHIYRRCVSMDQRHRLKPEYPHIDQIGYILGCAAGSGLGTLDNEIKCLGIGQIVLNTVTSQLTG